MARHKMPQKASAARSTAGTCLIRCHGNPQVTVSSVNRNACRAIKCAATPLRAAGVHIFGTCSPPKPPSSWGSCRFRRRCIQQGKSRSWELAARQLRRCRHTSCKRPCRYLPRRQAAVACRRVLLLRGQLCRRRRPSRSAARPLPQCTPPGCRTHTAVCQQSIEICNFPT